MNPSPVSHRVLVVDDTTAIHSDFQKILCPENVAQESMISLEAAFLGEEECYPCQDISYELAHAYQGREAFEMVCASLEANEAFKLAFVDMRMPPGWDGLETIRNLWSVDPDLQVVICTAYSDHTWREINLALGQSDSLIILRKPFDNIEVAQLANALCKKWDLATENRQKVARLDATVARKQHELIDAEDRFLQAFNASPLPQAIQSLPEGHLVEINQAFTELFMLERDQALGHPPALLHPCLDRPDWQSALQKLTCGESVDNPGTIWLLPDGDEHMLGFHARPVKIGGRAHCIWVFQDLSEKAELEKQYRQAQKMEAIGQLSAGVAHDFNNVLTGIQGFTNIAMTRPEVGPELRSDLEMVLTATSRAAGLTRQLLLFSRKQAAEETVFSPAEFLTEIRPLIEPLLGAEIELECDCHTGLASIQAERANIEHLLLNLVTNARDAMNEGGCIKVAAREMIISADEVTRHADAREGNFVRFEVADDGCGIDPENIPHLFEPFFTTKEVGKGTGLGLATCYGIARQHRGWMEVDSNLGEGTTFSFYLPVTLQDDSPLEASAPAAPAEESKLIDPPSLSVLIVEDDPLVGRVIEQTLKDHGYQTELAECGPVALNEWHRHGGFDLVISDMVMPYGFSGARLADELLALRPNLPVLLITGYSEEILYARLSDELLKTCTILMKPFDGENLLKKVRGLLAQAPPRTWTPARELASYTDSQP